MKVDLTVDVLEAVAAILGLLTVLLALACPSPPQPRAVTAADVVDVEPTDPKFEADPVKRQARKASPRARPAPAPEAAAPLGPDFDPSLIGQVDGALSETERALREIRARRGKP